MYLDTLYKEIITMIRDYKKEIAKNKIERNENPIMQLEILEKEDKNRFNSRYKYIIDILKVLVAEKISDNNNEKEYERYKQKNIENVYLLYDIIQNPENENR